MVIFYTELNISQKDYIFSIYYKKKQKILLAFIKMLSYLLQTQKK